MDITYYFSSFENNSKRRQPKNELENNMPWDIQFDSILGASTQNDSVELISSNSLIKYVNTYDIGSYVGVITIILVYIKRFCRKETV